MELFFSTNDFQLNGVSYPDFPILLDSEMNIVQEVFYFLIKQCIKRGRVKSPRSWAAYGQSIYDFFGFLEANDLNWRESNTYCDHTILAAYRDWSLGELGLKASTVNYRLRIIIQFYKYAYDKGWIDSVPYDLETVMVRQGKGFLAHTDTTGGMRESPDVMLKHQDTQIKVLSKYQVKKFLQAIKNPTQKLIARLALSTGLRREELATFPVKYVVNPTRYDMHKAFIRVNIQSEDMKTKGDKARGIDVPRALMQDLWEYVLHERNALQQISSEQQRELFLNKNGRPYANSGKTLNNLWHCLDLPFKVTPHMLRHTYATHTLYDLRKRQIQIDPLLYVRDRLGHVSIHTTEKYLHFLSEIEDDLMTEYQKELDTISVGDN